MAEVELKRCPFCNGEADFDVGDFGGMVCYCKNVFLKVRNVTLKKRL